jgi:hypothetical protein
MKTAVERIAATLLRADREHVRVNADGYHVATISPHMNDRAEYARLFAAAPALLASLTALTDWAREHTSPTDANSPHALLVAGVAAIALATS